MEKYSIDEYKKILKENDREDQCYNVDAHDCSGSCQGCSDCYFAQYIKGILKRKPSRQKMMKQIINGLISKKIIEDFLRSDEGKEMMLKIKRIQ